MTVLKSSSSEKMICWIDTPSRRFITSVVLPCFNFDWPCRSCFKFCLACSVVGVFCHHYPPANIPVYCYLLWWVADPLDWIHFKLFLLHHALFFAWMRHGKIHVLAGTGALVVIVFSQTIPRKNLARNVRWSGNDETWNRLHNRYRTLLDHWRRNNAQPPWMEKKRTTSRHYIDAGSRNVGHGSRMVLSIWSIRTRCRLTRWYRSFVANYG